MPRKPTLKTPGSLLISKGFVPHRLPPAVSLMRDFLIIFPAANIVVVWVSFLFGVPITSAHLLVSLFFCAAAAFMWQGQKSVRRSLVAFLLLSLLFISAIFLSISLIDIYGDSRSYHGPAVIALSDGWNPLYEWNVCEWDDTYCMRTSKFIDHYPKGQWYISAEFYSLFKNLDTGKCMNLLMLALCFIVAYDVVRSLLPDQRSVSLVISAVIAANPVSIAQLFSGTVDGLLSSALSIFILLQVRYALSNEKKYIFLSVVISVYLTNIKFTGLIYAVTFLILLVLIILITRRKLHFSLAFISFIGLSVSAIVFGFNPYITNTVLHRNPFAQAVDLDSGASAIDRQADPDFIAQNRFEKFAIATFSVGTESDIKRPEFAIPLSRWDLNRGIAVRFAGFGPVFSAIFLISILQATRLRDGPSIALIFCVLITVFSTSAGWWPRLAPQTWLVICLVQLAVRATVKGEWSHRVGMAVLIALLLNSSLVFAGVFSHQKRSSSKFFRDLGAAKDKSLHVVVTDNRFGLVGFYNRHKLVDSLGSDDQVVEDCEPRRQNRIFGICREPIPPQ